MSVIEKSEIFRANQSCENANIVTIATIFPTCKKNWGIIQRKISYKVNELADWTPIDREPESNTGLEPTRSCTTC